MCRQKQILSKTRAKVMLGGRGSKVTLPNVLKIPTRSAFPAALACSARRFADALRPSTPASAWAFSPLETEAAPPPDRRSGPALRHDGRVAGRARHAASPHARTRALSSRIFLSLSLFERGSVAPLCFQIKSSLLFPEADDRNEGKKSEVVCFQASRELSPPGFSRDRGEGGVLIHLREHTRSGSHCRKRCHTCDLYPR